ncbi:MAG TPA: glycosyltransferase [Pseudolabrys sp.]|nr:glycosyltransferase [Pseudolabrys sp.]
MLSAIIATRESERALARTLAALVPGATSGVLRDVIVADGGSQDATEDVADLAGCRFMKSTRSIGERLKAAAATARGPWLMFLRAGAVPGENWIAAVESFIATAERFGKTNHAATFGPEPPVAKPGLAGVLASMRLAVGRGVRPVQGLLIGKRFYESIGGHPGGEDAEALLLSRIGRRHVALLPCPISWTGNRSDT